MTKIMQGVLMDLVRHPEGIFTTSQHKRNAADRLSALGLVNVTWTVKGARIDVITLVDD